MNVLTVITLLFSILSVVFSQRFLYGRESPYLNGQLYRTQQFKPLKAVAILNGKGVTGVINFEQIVCIFGFLYQSLKCNFKILDCIFI